jgi:hypothetical protein
LFAQTTIRSVILGTGLCLLLWGGINLVTPASLAAPAASTAPPGIDLDPTASPSLVGPSASPTFWPLVSAVPTGTPGLAAPTRLAIPSLGIDIATIRPPDNETFPYCDVTEYIPSGSLPGGSGLIWIYGHARAGMLLPLLTASMRANGASLMGALVNVWTADNMLHIYTVTQVVRHQSINAAIPPFGSGETLLVQTSETAYDWGTKLLVFAKPTSTIGANQRDAHPHPHPRTCR